MWKKPRVQVPAWLACSVVLIVLAGIGVGVCFGGMAAVQVPAVQWVLAVLGATGLGVLSFLALRRYVREWRARLFGKNSHALVRSVRIGRGSGESKDPDHATVIIDGEDSEVDIILDRLVAAGDRIRVRYHPSRPQDATHIGSWPGYLVGAVVTDAFMLMIIVITGAFPVALLVQLVRALGIDW